MLGDLGRLFHPLRSGRVVKLTPVCFLAVFPPFSRSEWGVNSGFVLVVGVLHILDLCLSTQDSQCVAADLSDPDVTRPPCAPPETPDYDAT